MDLSVQSAIADAALIRDKKLKGYAIVGMKQFAGLPGLKTLGELGYK